MSGKKKTPKNRSEHITNRLDSSVLFSNEIKGPKPYQKKLEAFSRELLGELIDQWPNEASPIKKARREYRETLQLIVHHLAVSHSRVGSHGVAIDMNEGHYGKHAKPSYEGLSYDRMARLVRMLTGHKSKTKPEFLPSPGLHWCHITPGYRDPVSGAGFLTRIAPFGELADRLLRAGLIFVGCPTGPVKKKPDPGLGYLRINVDDDDHTEEDDPSDKDDKKHVSVHRPPTNLETVIPLLTDRLRKAKPSISFPSYEAYKSSFRWDHKHQQMRSRAYPGNDTFYRLFTEEDGIGGRIYGHWIQGVPSDLRRFVTFNGEPTVEYDYRSAQPALALSSLGVTSGRDDGDLYAVPDHPRRKFRTKFKLVFRVALGCSPDRQIIPAINGRLVKEGHLPKPGEAEALFKAFFDHHQDLASVVLDNVDGKIVGKAAWKSLMKIESDVSLTIIRTLLDQDIPCCPIFDSFIVEERHEGALVDAMTDAVAHLSWPPVPDKKEPEE